MAPPMPRQVVIKPITISKIGSADDYYYYYHPDYNYYSDQQYDNYYFEYPSNDYYSDYSKLYSNSASNDLVARRGVSGPFHSNAQSKARWLQKSGYPNLKRNGVAQSGQSGSQALQQMSSSASSHYGDDCCPHVLDPGIFITFLAGIAVATFLLRQSIIMNIGRKRKKRFISSMLKPVIFEGD